MRNVTLRRAAKIRNRLETRVAELSMKLRQVHVSINVHDTNIVAQLSEKENQYRELMGRYVAASGVLTNLRLRIGTSNATTGLNDLLTQQTALLGQLRTVQTVSDLDEPRLSDDQLLVRSAAQSQRAKTVETYGNSDVMNVTFVSATLIEDAKSTAQELQSMH
jgi:hypothetical protein